MDRSLHHCVRDRLRVSCFSGLGRQRSVCALLWEADLAIRGSVRYKRLYSGRYSPCHTATFGMSCTTQLASVGNTKVAFQIWSLQMSKGRKVAVTGVFMLALV